MDRPISNREDMAIEYSLSETDVLLFNRYIRKQSTGHQRKMLRLRVSYLLGCLLIAIGFWFIVPGSPLPIAFILLGTIIFLITPYLVERRLERRTQDTYQNEANRALFEKRILRVTSEGLEEKSDFGETKVYWKSIDEIYVAPSFTVISVHQKPSVMIPQESVSSGDYDIFIQALQKYKAGSAEGLNQLASN